MDAPKFQAYLRQQLIFEHHRIRLERSRRNWRVTALAAMAVCALSIARPGVPAGARHKVSALLGTAPPETVDRFASAEESFPLARTLEASLAHDKALARQLGARSIGGAVEPEHAFVVSRFPVSGGRAVSIYTPLTSRLDDERNDAAFATDGGIW